MRLDGVMYAGVLSRECRDAYQRLYHSGQSLVKLKDAALGGRLFDIDDAAPGVAGRSLAWKVCVH